MNHPSRFFPITLMFLPGSRLSPTTRQHPLRIARLLGAISLVFVLASCAQLPSVPQTPPPPIGSGYLEQLAIPEPDPQEVVVVVNDNLKMVHAGMFAGHALLDPAGSYEHSRNQDSAWEGVSLRDYVRFQLDDGPAVKLYRFHLSPDRFALIKERVDNAGRTMPLFCAAKVQNIISGIEPFESVPDAWLVSPSTLARHLDAILLANGNTGACVWPNGTSCYPAQKGEALEVVKK